ncbi:hypothetical protein DSM107133_04977 (plasmid) [Pseudosulfitobacter sp. DSM 107133]|nr:hypothetical protein DSM107133_04977 [Pseudosulfitobacter sp. DSM 107133]
MGYHTKWSAPLAHGNYEGGLIADPLKPPLGYFKNNEEL